MNTLTTVPTSQPRASTWRIYRAEALCELRRALAHAGFRAPLAAVSGAVLCAVRDTARARSCAAVSAGHLLRVRCDGPGAVRLRRAAGAGPRRRPAYAEARAAVAADGAVAGAAADGGAVRAAGGAGAAGGGRPGRGGTGTGMVLRLLAVAAFAALPLGAIGLWIGSHVSASAAPAVVNLVYLPLALLSGLWLPLSILPPVFSALAPLWPTRHLAQLALPAVGLPAQGSTWVHIAVLLAVTGVALGLARRRLRRVG
ncbi:ABC transporter permease [Stenotrophomonas rhizophila]